MADLEGPRQVSVGERVQEACGPSDPQVLVRGQKAVQAERPGQERQKK